MSIDWNTAPEGATHWEPRGIVFGEGWMKKVGNEWSYWLEGSEVWAGVWADCFVSAEREATFEARPQEAWDGQGFPPIGIEAEAIWDGADIAYFRAKILAHDEGRVVFRWCEGKRKGQYGSYAVLKFGSLPAFRPLRTPEQIAAEEREKAVGDMAMSIQGVPYQYPTLYALFDAGYRRQEEGK
ncbi:TPA: hypothetical protein L5W23_005791 [Pseudomonas aeruginosa]|uniref:hypothetical protein n=2 Tax=Pseudomonas aeruginosa TaxID=287 RepID=UPI000BB8E88A|nr:hypothetical protein [Pseudomonas aeruginosa]EKY4191226.1 hypothetical protein [Pseudomonas aeruginosa]ELL1263219.1 hypothetical protein [Pseudomonas aeruginosa]MBI7334148.1 hypothetical protein [Pseudomonas aeruginosa]PBX96839.1 hypothetical protein CJT66_19080 [Pseudomonas aeruginosa]PBY01626.1 hypothetical protein CJT65_29385 [Pseudomonas aeruginosa]